MEQRGPGMEDRGSSAGAEPPGPIRMRYYLWDIRVPPTWLPWVEADIDSAAWLGREVARFFLTFLVLAAIFNRLDFTLLTWACLALGCAGIVAGRQYLRQVALAYQRYGWDWSFSASGVGTWIRIGYAVLFTIVFFLLAV